ncbi:MAG: FAD-dependent oxidoreductase, partial [Tepidiformaceae bacterium]
MTLETLAAGPPLDLAIIGGGINGCGIAEEAAARGLRVALFEADDFGFGTTWRSTKLIHGGLRYLEHGDVRLVFESLRERAWLLKTRPHLVKPQRFILPMLPWTRRPAWQLRLGLAAYDLLSLYRAVPSHRKLKDGRLHELASALPEETRGGFTFYDARVIAPERLALEMALEARQQGAVIQNHARVARV